MIDAQCKEEGICAGLGLLRELPMDGGSITAQKKGRKKNRSMFNTSQINIKTDILW